MSMTIHVDIVSAEGEIHSGVAEMVYAPAEMGELGIAPRHAPLITRLKPGDIRVQTKPGQIEHFYVSGGILEVRARDLDEAAALEAKRRAEAVIAGKTAEFEYAKAQSELADAVAKLRAIENLRKRTAR